MAATGRIKQRQPILQRRRTRVLSSILVLCPTSTSCLTSPPCNAKTPVTALHLRSDSLRRSGRFQTNLFAFSNSYGRGAEIWPECNEVPIQLSESFPGGKIPDAARQALQRQQQQSTNSDISLFKKVLNNATTMDKLTAAVAAAVLIGGFVPFLDVLLATGWSTYLWWLLRLAQAPRRAEKDATVKVPKLPSLPPQGHVPLLVSNPLGYALSNSKKYQQWLDVGVILGLFGPILLLSRYTLWTAAPHNQLEAAAACARPLFWLCCHAMTEAVARNVLMPLPIRILIPISHNFLRLGPLWAWAAAPCSLNLVGRLLAVANWVYAMTNLLGFLLPIASLRYLRAHFFAVEAKEVHLQETLDQWIL